MASKNATSGAPTNPDGVSPETTHFGARNVKLEEKQHLVDDVFRTVASRYDLMNDLLSGGLHRLWKDAMVSSLAPPTSTNSRAAYRVLDTAGGTGDIAFRIVERSNGAANVTVCDINENMLSEGQRRAQGFNVSDQVDFVTGNAESLPFEDRQFDAYTIAFGIRNVPRIEKALSEAYRVLKRGGKFLCLEFSKVDLPLLDEIYSSYSRNVIPRIGDYVVGDGEPYQYLVESIEKFPNPERFAFMIQQAGFHNVKYTLYSGGITALHVGWKY